MELVTSPQNARVKLAASLRLRKHREEHKLVLVEGVRAIRQAVDFGARFSYFLVDRDRMDSDELERLNGAGADVLAVPEGLLRKVSDTPSPQWIIGVAHASSEDALDINSAQWIVVADGLQDPGNLGTLMRLAAAVDADGLVTTKGTVDPGHPRTIRASAGAYFRVPLLCGVEPAAFREELGLAGYRVVVADARGEHDVFSFPWESRLAMVIGSEANGPSPPMRRAERVSIPMPGGIESLNAAVAAGILLYQAWHARGSLSTHGSGGIMAHTSDEGEE